MELRPIEQLAEDERNLLFHDAGAVVLHANFVTVGSRLFDVNPQLGQYACFLAGIERIIDGLFHRGK